MGLFLQIVDNVLLQLQRAGFRAVFADGHGPSRRSWVADEGRQLLEASIPIVGRLLEAAGI